MEQGLGAHPYHFIKNLVLEHGPAVRFEFSRYHYTPQNTTDLRSCFDVRGDELSTGWVLRTLESLAEREELAIHSRVVLSNGELRHIPMIDFVGELGSRAQATLVSVLDGLGIDSLSLYESGRSFHGYGQTLISDNAWSSFMGTILLTNLPGEEHIVDCRWVGHRLRAGYASLRWSCNTPQYTQLPTHALNLSIQACRPPQQVAG